MVELNEVLGRSKRHEEIKDYTGADEYAEQGDYRIVKDLMFVYHVLEPNPSMPSAGDIVVERVGKRGEAVDVEELGPLYLEKGERLGSFFTDEELKNLRPQQVRETFQLTGIHESVKELVGAQHAISSSSESSSGGGSGEISTMGSQEIAEYLEENKPNVQETIALAEGDPETAQRVLEAENIATDNDPRQGVVDGLSRIIGEGR